MEQITTTLHTLNTNIKMNSIASKLFFALAALASNQASAFVPHIHASLLQTSIESSESESSLRLSKEVQVLAEIPNDPVNLNELIRKSQSKAIPFMKRPDLLNGSMAGDVGFDPLGFAKSPELVKSYREAEVKHARLAMLAAAGWPLSELLDKKIAGILHLVPALDSAGRAAPFTSETIGNEFWVGCLVFASLVDLWGATRSFTNESDYFPGNLGFDPLGLYPDSDDPEGQKSMQLAEIKHGRVAMVVFACYFIEESLTKSSLFNPLGN